MKHKFFDPIVWLISMTMLFLCCSNCSEGDSGNGTSDKPYLRVSFSEKTVGNSTGSTELYVESNTEWIAESRSKWIHMDATRGKGNLAVRLSYDENEDPEGNPKRMGAVRFNAVGVNPVEVVLTQSALVFTNPIPIDGQMATMPDPYIVQDGEWYYACKASGNGIGISKSKRLTEIAATTKVWSMPSENASMKPWNVKDLWAPELFHIGNRWYVYYAAGRRDLPDTDNTTISGYGSQRTGVLRSKTDDPLTGGWEDMGMLYTGESDDVPTGDAITRENTEYAIDMTTFEVNGHRYAVWSGNRKTNSVQQIRIAKMSNPHTISSGFRILSSPDQPWEKLSSTVNEGPAVLVNKEKGKIFIVYSCNGSWTKHYKLGWLMLNIGDDPMEPSNWQKSSGAVFDRLDNTSSPIYGVNGVGHNTFTKSPDGTEDWIVYHVMAFRDDNDGGGGWGTRYPFIQRFTWNEDGTPDFGTPVSWGEPLDLPSGEDR